MAIFIKLLEQWLALIYIYVHRQGAHHGGGSTQCKSCIYFLNKYI